MWVILWKRGQVGVGSVCREKLEKTIILFTKVLLDFLEYHPFPFIPLIQRCLEFSVSFVFTAAGDGLLFERFIVQCMNLIKSIVKNEAYRPDKNIEDSKPEVLEAHKIKTAFFTHPTLTEIAKRLVSKYFLLTEEELVMWEEDPEGFAVEETGGDSWKYSLRILSSMFSSVCLFPSAVFDLERVFLKNLLRWQLICSGGICSAQSVSPSPAVTL
ncbi:hypothetical protein MHYP_G00347200 [Metynnis hypsauchen]